MVSSSLSPIRDTLDSMYLADPMLDHWLGLDPVVEEWPSHPVKPDIQSSGTYSQPQTLAAGDFELDLSKLSDLSEIKFDLDNMDDFSEDSLGSPLIDNLHDKQSFTHVLDELIEGRKGVSLPFSIDNVKSQMNSEEDTNELSDIEFDLDYMDELLNDDISLTLIDNLNDKVPVNDNQQNTLIEEFDEKDDLDFFLEDSLDGSDSFDEMEPLMGKLQDILDPLIGRYQEVPEDVEEFVSDKSPKKEDIKEVDIKKEEEDPLALALQGIFEESGNHCFVDPKVEVKDENPIKQDCMWGDKTRTRKKRQRKFSFTISQMMDTKTTMPDICAPTSSSLLTSSRKFSISIPDDFYLECPFETPKEESKEESSSDVEMDDEEDYLNKVRKSMPGENSVIVVRKNKMSTKIEVEESDQSPHLDHNYCLPAKHQQKASTSYGLLTPPPSDQEPEEEEGELSSRISHQALKYHYRLPPTKKKKELKSESKSLLKNSKHKIKIKFNHKSRPGEEGNNTLRKPRGVKKITKKIIAAQSERQRRVEIGLSFDIVKAAVPSLAKTERVSKLEILAVATDYCQTLTEKGGKLKDRVEKARKENADMKNRLNKLRLEISRTVSIL